MLSCRRSSRLVGHDSASSTWPSEPAEAINTEETVQQSPQNGNGVAKSDIDASSDEAALRVGLSSKGSKRIAGFWGAYSKALEEHPIRVKSATSFFGFLFGDAVAQLVVGNPYNYMRTVRMVLFGILMDGPVGKFLLAAETKRSSDASCDSKSRIYYYWCRSLFYQDSCSLDLQVTSGILSWMEKCILTSPRAIKQSSPRCFVIS